MWYPVRQHSVYVFVGNDVVNAEEETVDMSGSDGDVNVEDAVSAKIKGTDESNDLAVVAVQKSDIPEDTLSQIKIAQLGNSDDLQVGEQVVAIGNALEMDNQLPPMGSVHEQKHFYR